MHRFRDALATLGEGLCEVAWPTRCVGCDALGSLLCPECRKLLPAICQRHACPVCGAPFGRIACTECARCLSREPGDDPVRPDPVPDPFESLDALRSYGMLEWPLDRMVRAYKDAGERRLAGLLGGFLATAARDGYGPRLDDVAGVAFVPCTPQAYARRGYDHMELVAREAARALGLPLRDVLARRSPRDQRDLSREGRAANARGSFAVLAPPGAGAVLLVDDVFTTGATMAAAAQALKGRGAAQVLGATVARAWAG